MSRCIPFPPRGYVWKGVSGKALLEVIQVRRENAAAEKRRKEEERRRRKRREKESEKELEEGEIREIECGHNKKHKKKIKKCEETCGDDDDDHYQMMKNNSGRHENLLELERSSLTEEHDHHGLYDSSDNTENVRPKSVTQEQLSSASTASSVQHIESQFRELMVHCVPSPIQTEHCEFDDQEWLFERRLPPSSSSSRKNPPAVSSASNADDDSCLASSSTYPSARYLPRADIYALPYTVLF
ncbi:hypothetical protein ACOSQ2_006086 [Xanthoceras sorbifolium]